MCTPQEHGSTPTYSKLVAMANISAGRENWRIQSQTRAPIALLCAPAFPNLSQPGHRAPPQLHLQNTSNLNPISCSGLELIVLLKLGHLLGVKSP